MRVARGSSTLFPTATSSPSSYIVRKAGTARHTELSGTITWKTVELRPLIRHPAGQPAKTGARNRPDDACHQGPQEKTKPGENGMHVPGVAMPHFVNAGRQPIQHRRRRDTALQVEDC